jgi:hypothetical protein
MELLWNFSPRLGRLEGRTFRPCLPYLASFEINRREYDTMFPQHLALGHSFCDSSPQLIKCSFLSDPLKAKSVELMGKEKGYNSSHVYCQAKGWSKNS